MYKVKDKKTGELFAAKVDKKNDQDFLKEAKIQLMLSGEEGFPTVHFGDRQWIQLNGASKETFQRVIVMDLKGDNL